MHKHDKPTGPSGNFNLTTHKVLLTKTGKKCRLMV